MFKLIVFRHGQSTFQCLRIIAGENEYGLTALGRHQTYRMAQEMREMKFHYALSSDIRRTAETLDIILENVRERPPPENVYYSAALREKDQGVLKLKHLTTSKQNDFDRLAREEGGENWDDVKDRVEGLLHLLLLRLLRHPLHPNKLDKVPPDLLDVFQARHQHPLPCVLLVTHFGFIKELIYLIRQNMFGNLPQPQINMGYYAQNAAIIEIDIHKTPNSWSAEIMQLNGSKPLYQPFI